MSHLKVIGRDCLSAYLGEMSSVTTSPYAMGVADMIVVADDGAWAVTLPAAASALGYIFYVKRMGATSLSLDASEDIDGSGTAIVVDDCETYQLYSDGVEWFILGRFV